MNRNELIKLPQSSLSNGHSTFNSGMLAHKDTGYPVAFVTSMPLKEMLTHGISTLAMRDDAPVP